MAYDEKTGMTEYTSGEAQAWIGGGETKVVAQSAASFTYGAKTDVSISVSSSFSIGLKTALSLGASTEVACNIGFSIKKDYSLNVSKDHKAYYSDSAVIKVGIANVSAAARYKALEKATWILMIAQTAAAIAFASIAVEKLVHKQSLDKDKTLQEQQKKADDKVKKGETPDQSELSDDYGAKYHKAPSTNGEKALHFYRTFPMGYIASCLTILTSLSAFIVLLVQRYKGTTADADPNAVLSMEKESAAFLGIQPFGKTASAGAAFNAEGIVLSTSSEDLKFQKVDDAPQIIGFEKEPDAAKVGGARLKLAANGDINTWGKNLSLEASGPAAYQAPSHRFYIPKGGKGVERLFLDPAVARLYVDDNSFVTVQRGEVDIKGGGSSFVKLDDKTAVLSSNGAELTLTAQKASLTYGNSKVEIGASGVKIGGALEIISPGVAITSAKLAKIIANATKLKTLTLKAQQALRLANTTQTAKYQALTARTKAQITARTLVEKASDSASKKKTP